LKRDHLLCREGSKQQEIIECMLDRAR